jgi:hypothetical protein
LKPKDKFLLLMYSFSSAYYLVQVLNQLLFLRKEEDHEEGIHGTVTGRTFFIKLLRTSMKYVQLCQVLIKCE